MFSTGVGDGSRFYAVLIVLKVNADLALADILFSNPKRLVLGHERTCSHSFMAVLERSEIKLCQRVGLI
jgi:hypothetical protein